MFHTYTFSSTAFQDWLKATNQLYLSLHLELKRPRQDYVFTQARDLKAQPQDQFLLFCEDEAGICGSAVITALPYDLEINDQVVPQGTWVLRNVFFHLRKRNPLQYQADKFICLVERFYLGLFEHLWHLAQRSNHRVVLSLQHDLEAHEDLAYFGGFTFSTEMTEQEGNLVVDLAVMPLTALTYKTYQQKIKQHQQNYRMLPNGQPSRSKRVS